MARGARQSEGLTLSGRCRLTAYPQGMILSLIRSRRMTLEDAKSYARKWAVFSDERANLVVDTGRQLLCEMLIDGYGYDTGITYHAIGDDDTTPSAADVLLGNELHRKAATSRYRVDNSLIIDTFYPADECTYAIEEAGLFGHSTATAAANSGVLVARYLQPYDNSDGDVDLNFQWNLLIAVTGGLLARGR